MAADLFEFADDREKQTKHKARVKDAIAATVLKFVTHRFENEDTSQRGFRAHELSDFVARFHTVAPDSAGRIMRDLRTSGDLDYKVISRRKSMYWITMVKGIADRMEKTDGR
jgi:hypothetical protein